MDTRKKILLCITKSTAGGAQKYIYDLATHLSADAFKIVVVAGGLGPLFDILKKREIRTITVPGLGRDVNPLRELRAFYYLIKIFVRERPDIIHLNSTKMGTMGAIAAQISKVFALNFKSRVMFTVHGWGFREDRNTLQRMIIFGISWISSFFHDHVIVINSADHHDARAFIPTKKCSNIALGIETSDLLSREEAREFFSNIAGRSFDDNTIIIGTTAELTKNKGLSYLVDALHHLLLSSKESNIHCIIMGEGEERKRLEEQIKKLNLSHHISLAGFVADAYRYLSGLDLFALTSVKEGLPYALMEAMASGLPVIASRVGGVPDLITHQKNGILVPAKNPSEFKKHFEDFLTSRPLLTTLGMHAKKTITEHYSLPAMITKTSHLYHELTQSH